MVLKSCNNWFRCLILANAVILTVSVRNIDEEIVRDVIFSNFTGAKLLPRDRSGDSPLDVSISASLNQIVEVDADRQVKLV